MDYYYINLKHERDRIGEFVATFPHNTQKSIIEKSMRVQFGDRFISAYLTIVVNYHPDNVPVFVTDSREV